MTIKTGTKTIEFSTGDNDEIVDITADVIKAVEAFGLSEGVVTVFVVGSTLAVTTMEFEPGLESDVKALLSELISGTKNWRHNATWGDGNGHSHLKASLIGPSLSIPVNAGQPILGTWQQIVVLDFDIKARTRRVVLQLTGEVRV